MGTIFFSTICESVHWGVKQFAKLVDLLYARQRPHQNWWPNLNRSHTQCVSLTFSLLLWSCSDLVWIFTIHFVHLVGSKWNMEKFGWECGWKSLVCVVRARVLCGWRSEWKGGWKGKMSFRTSFWRQRGVSEWRSIFFPYFLSAFKTFFSAFDGLLDGLSDGLLDGLPNGLPVVRHMQRTVSGPLARLTCLVCGSLSWDSWNEERERKKV